jgi:DNA mismatch endonuclease (patch repair protein)
MRQKRTTNRTTEARSKIMRAVKSQSTSPEVAVRDQLRPFGLRVRFNAPYLPGKPDIAIHSIMLAIFVNGCFWHGHGCKRGSRSPKTNAEYWTAKIARNRARDRQNTALLRRKGWKVLTIWECDSVPSRARKLKRALAVRRSA